eukprot:7285772-Prymnesium_polylepis.1
MLSLLVLLGTMTTNASGAVTAFVPQLGSKCNYTFNSHPYDVEVKSITPPPPPPPPPPVPPNAWANKILFEESPVTLSTDYLESLLKSCPSGDDCTTKSTLLANLAELFSSFGQQFKYDASKTVL